MTIENLEAQPAKEQEGHPLEPVDRSKVDLAYLHEVITRKLKVERRPVAVTYCPEQAPEEYEELKAPACALIKESAAGRHVYVKEGNDACLVGQYHIGMHQGSDLIKEGRYLTMAQAMFTEEGARHNKASTPNLPLGLYRAIAAAPLNEVSENVPVHQMVVICDPQRAMMIAGAAMARGGDFALGELGWSVCASLYALPYYRKRSLFTIGDGGGRIHNSLKPSELFVVIPSNDLPFLIELIENFSIKPQEMRREIMPGFYATQPHNSGPGRQ
ncbi:MAG TPA: DUF169 domain-containing protein [Chloroflexia bacterium]|nr:DUF169 domain-containing protein [Chloroflexia bacterium]